VFKRNKFKKQWNEERGKLIRLLMKYVADRWYPEEPSEAQVVVMMDKATGGFGVSADELEYAGQVYFRRIADRENFGPFATGENGEFMIDFSKEPPMSGDPEDEFLNDPNWLIHNPYERPVLTQEELEACVDAGNELMPEEE
jgi:hypothetical protein